MKPKVSVIVPVLNREKLVIRCLESIKRQRVRPYELIVIDNGSEDGTVNAVTQWMLSNGGTRMKMHIHEEKRRGACRARQKGLENAKGDFVLFFDSDDEMEPELIAESIKNADSKTDIVCWKCRINLLSGGKKVSPFDPDHPVENHLIHSLLRPQGYMVRRDYLIKRGGWEKNLKVWNDYELGLRLLIGNPKIKGINKILATIHSQKDSITGKDFSHKEGEWDKILQEMKHENTSGNHPEKKNIGKIITYREIILAAHYAKEGNKSAAKRLYQSAIKKASSSDKALLRIAYYYTRRGGRGIWRILRHLYI